MMVFFALMLGLYMVPVVGRATLETPLRVAAVKASSAMKPWKGYTFDAANLIDGRVDTSWQPAKEFGLGVGQWVELDLGRPYEIWKIEIEQGLQKVDPVLGDLFCRNNRFVEATLLFENGTFADVYSAPGEVTTEVRDFYRVESVAVPAVPAITQRLRLIVGNVNEPVDWDDLAIAEIRVFGWPATPPPVDPRGIVCEQQGGWPLRVALSDYCAVDVATYDERLCWELLYDIARCQSTPYKRGATPIPTLTPGADGAYVLEISEHSTHRLELAPTPDGRLVVGRHTIDGRDQPIPPKSRARREDPLGAYGQRKYTHPDFNATNTCWEKLGKTRREIADEER